MEMCCQESCLNKVLSIKVSEFRSLRLRGFLSRTSLICHFPLRLPQRVLTTILLEQMVFSFIGIVAVIQTIGIMWVYGKYLS